MRYVILGAGAIGATIGGRLHMAGRDVVLIARGAHRAVLERDGLRLQDPDREDVLRIPVVEVPAQLRLGPGDVVVLAVKGQDTAAALEALAPVCDPGAAIVCAQNGVENERAALRRFAGVYGMLTCLPAAHVEPGVVQSFAAPVPGVLDLGRVPQGSDARAERIAADLAAAGFVSRASDEIMAWKHAKLLSNVGNAVNAGLEPSPRAEAIEDAARREARACYAAAGLRVVDDAELAERNALMSTPRAVGRVAFGSSSSAQSLARGTGAIEASSLNGEIVLLGRLHGVPTPVNEALMRFAERMARGRRPPRSATPDEVARLLALAEAG